MKVFAFVILGKVDLERPTTKGGNDKKAKYSKDETILSLSSSRVVLAMAAIEASPAKKKIEPKCVSFCTTDYKPVCAGIPNDKSVKPKLFANECVLGIHNCEHKSNLVQIPFNYCENAGGVRLS